VLDDIAENGDILLAIFRDTVFLSGTPPFHRLQSVAALCSAERVLCQLVELHAMAKRLEKFFVDVKGPLLEFVNGRIRAENFEIEAVAVEGDDVREFLKLGYKFFRVFLKPAAKTLVLVPCYCDGDAESADVRPSAFDLVRKPKRFNVQIYLSIK
jgi:hypothetical protein